MSNVEHTADWAQFRINLDNGHIHCDERWHYHFWMGPGAQGSWVRTPGAAFGVGTYEWRVPRWQTREAQQFHRDVDNQIQRVWNNHGVPIRATGSPFAARFPTVHVEFDVILGSITIEPQATWVPRPRPRTYSPSPGLARGAWKINVYRESVITGTSPHDSETFFTEREMDLFIGSGLWDYRVAQVLTNDCGVAPRRGQYLATHEFGHTLFNPIDEYHAPICSTLDADRIMSRGRQVHAEHMTGVVMELNVAARGATGTDLAGTTFSV